MPPLKINPNLIFLTGVIFAVIGIMIGCEILFHDGQIFTLFVGFLNLLIGILIGAFKSVFHISDGQVPQIPQLPQLPQQAPTDSAPSVPAPPAVTIPLRRP